MSICDLSIGGGTSIGRLNCSSFQDRGSKSIALPLIRSIKDEKTFSRVRGAPVLVSSSLFPESTRAHVYLHRGEADLGHFFVCRFKTNLWLLRKEASYMVEEFYPPAWREILSNGVMWNQRENLETQQQSILFLCKIVGWPNFAVRIDYTFQLGDSQLRPQELQYHAAFSEKGKALAELMIENRERMEAALDWRESLDFGNAELTFSLDKPELNGKTWVLQVNISEKQ